MIGLPRTALTLALVLGSACGDDDTPARTNCGPGELEAALAAAVEGATVEVGACELEGPFMVPAGVTLTGAGSATVLHVAADGIGVSLETGAGTSTRLTDLSIASDGRAAVVAKAEGAGSVELASVQIHVTLGVGVAAERLEGFVASELTIAGPITAENAGDVSDLGLTATYGLVLFEVPSVELTNVNVAGFAATGALLVRSGTVDDPCSWSGGEITQNIGSGLMVAGGFADLQALSIADNVRGTLLVRTYGAIFGGGASITSDGLEVRGNEGPGLFQYDGASATHQDLIASENQLGGVWMQQTDGLTIQGAATVLDGNTFGGVVTVEATHPRIFDALIENTIPGTQETDDGPQTGACGFLFVRSTGVELHDVTSQFNDGIQGLFDQGGGDATGLVIEGVIVDGTETQLGCLDQNGNYPGDWDTGMTRRNGLGARDAAFEATGEMLDIAGIMGPEQLPAVPDDLAALDL